jgi:hypothetical protein
VKRSGCSPLPASAKAGASFLAFDVKNGTKPTTLSRRLAAIRYAHTLAGHPSPTASEAVKATLRGIKRTVRHHPARKAPATSDRVTAMVAPIGDGARGLRGASPARLCRRISALRACRTQRRGSRILRGRPASDNPKEQDRPRTCGRNHRNRSRFSGVSGECGTPLDSSKSDREWSNLSTRQQERKSAKSPSFRSRRRRSGESLCAAGWIEGGGFQCAFAASGFLTSAARRGASIFKMMDVSRHKSIETLRAYVRDAELFRDRAGSNLL